MVSLLVPSLAGTNIVLPPSAVTDTAIQPSFTTNMVTQPSFATTDMVILQLFATVVNTAVPPLLVTIDMATS